MTASELEPDDIDTAGPDAALQLLAETAPPGSHDRDRPTRAASPADADDLDDIGAIDVLRRGLAATPELRQGLLFTAGMALATAGGKLALPVLIQQILDRGVLDSDGFRPGFVAASCVGAAVLVVALYLVGRATYLRLVRAAEASLFGLRMRAFEHILRLSIAEHTERRRGALVARVTSDIETLAMFTEWGAVAWIVDSVVIVGTIAVMAAYSWQLAIVAVLAFVPLVPLLRMLQRRQLRAYDRVRTAVGESLNEVSEVVGGAAVVRAYGLEERSRRRLHAAIDEQYGAQLDAAKYFAVMFPLGDLFGALAIAAVVAVGVLNGEAIGLQAGELVAFLFLVQLLNTPIAELSEILDQTQTALAGWRKVLGVLETPIDIVEPDPGHDLAPGAPSIEVDRVRFSYRDGPPVLRGIDLDIPAGASVAVVGETGSGKTTLAKLLCRLADPTEGAIRIGGLDLRDISPASRRAAMRLVPQDGFLFDTTIGENVRAGRDGATGDDARAAFEALGLRWWLDDLPLGLETPVGERGGNISVGERQLVALARAQLADPGLLVLDEATSAVDPETERALTDALARLAAGRTVISIAHRLSTAEQADLILVFDDGRVVEQGTHEQLAAAGGVYARLHASWLGNTRGADAQD